MNGEAYFQLYLQLYVLINDGLPLGQILFVPQAVINILSIIASCASVAYGLSEIRLYKLYGDEPTILNVIKYSLTSWTPGQITALNGFYCIVLTFLEGYVNVVTYTDSNEAKIQLETKFIDVAMLIVICTLFRYTAWHGTLMHKLNVLREAELEIDYDSFFSKKDIFMLLKGKCYERNLIILFRKSVNGSRLIDLLLIAVSSYKIHTYDFNSSQCVEHFPENSCNLLENKLNRYNNFFFFSLISGVTLFVYKCIVFHPAVVKIMVNFIFILNEEENNEMNTNRAPKNNSEDVETALPRC